MFLIITLPTVSSTNIPTSKFQSRGMERIHKLSESVRVKMRVRGWVSSYRGSVTQDLWACLTSSNIQMVSGNEATSSEQVLDIISTLRSTAAALQRLGGPTEWHRFDRSYEYQSDRTSDRPSWWTLRASETEQTIWQEDIETCYSRVGGQRTGEHVYVCLWVCKIRCVFSAQQLQKLKDWTLIEFDREKKKLIPQKGLTDRLLWYSAFLQPIK